MIVLSRNRVETSRDDELARNLADFFGTSVLSIPFLYDLRSFGPTVERLRELEPMIFFAAPLPPRASASLLDGILKPRRSSDIFVAIADSSVSFEKLVSGFSVLNPVSEQPVALKDRVQRIEEPTVRRWYPVIDDKRCTGCLECVNFCLFGVYIIGNDDRPLVDQPDACRDGCPACSRVCPGKAIMFPMHEDEVIAGYADNDLGPTTAEAAQADRERSQHLDKSSDNLDDLVDQVDRFTL